MNRRNALRNGLTVCTVAAAPMLWATTATGSHDLRDWERQQLKATRLDMLEAAATVATAQAPSPAVLRPTKIVARTAEMLKFKNALGNTIVLTKTKKGAHTRFC